MGELHRPCPVCSGTGILAIPAGDRLRSVREGASLTQEAFAKSLGISRPSLANIEAGRQDIPTPLLLTIHRVYGSSIDWLLGITEATHGRS